MLEGGCGKIVNRSEVTDRFTMQPRPAVIAVKGFCDTKQVFAIYDDLPKTMEYKDNSALISALERGDDITGLNENALTVPSKTLNPAIAECMDILGVGASMSGSGSSVFAFDVDESKIQTLKERGFKVFPCFIGDFRTEVIKE
jgi:4-diphosphocytidyl-2C-methyl-D-erythritol kinase